MSIFNEASELASQLVFGRYYQSNEPCPKPHALVFVKSDSTEVVTAHPSWAETASAIERLLHADYRLVSTNQ
jgi:hypothetical protein